MNLQKPPFGIEWTRVVRSDGLILPGYTANPVRGCKHDCKWRMPNGDIAGCYAKDEWIDQVLACVERCPQHTFISLTKNPPRLQSIKRFPDNMWVGISAPPTFMFGKELTQEQQFAWLERGLNILDGIDASVTWISIEPLSFDISAHLAQFGKRLKWAVIGAASNGRKTFQPDEEDLRMALYAMKGRPVFFKGNLSKELANKVAGGWRSEFPQ